MGAQRLCPAWGPALRGAGSWEGAAERAALSARLLFEAHKLLITASPLLRTRKAPAGPREPLTQGWKCEAMCSSQGQPTPPLREATAQGTPAWPAQKELGLPRTGLLW